ncbi:MAG TPA: sigma-70 family RNA polymerase sigma factor [Chryseosolibacter sp.]
MEQAISVKQDRFKTWVLDYSDMLYSYAIVKGFDHDAAKDLVQDTFLAAWKNIDGFEGKASVKNWLFVILKNKITDQYRKTIHHISVDISQHDDYFDETGHWAKPVFPRALVLDPGSETEQNEFNRILEGCCNKLTRVQKMVFWMKYVDDVESDDICGQLAISANNYWTTLHRAKVQLRACIEKNWFFVKGI